MLERVFNKYKTLPVQAKAFFWFAVSNVIQKGISFICTPFLTRILSVEEYGVYNLYNSWHSIVIIFATLNLFLGVFNTGYTEFEGDRDRFISSLQGLSTTLTLGIALLFLLFIGFIERISKLNRILLFAMLFEFLLVPAFYYWGAKQRFEYKYKSLVFVTIISAFVSSLFSILAAYYSPSKKVEAKIITSIAINCAFYLYFYILNIKKGKVFYSSKYWKYALAFNIPLIPHYLSQTVLNQSDRIMISEICGEAATAFYGLAYNVSIIMTVIISAINDSYVPFTFQSIKRRETTALRKNTNLLLILVALLTLAVICVGPEIILILGTHEYSEAVWVIPPVACAIFFKFLYPLFANVEFYFKKPKYMTIASLFGAIANIVLNFVFIPIYGYVAAAYTTLVCYILFALAHYFVYLKIIKEHNDGIFLYDIKTFTIIAIIVLVIMVIMLFVYSHVVIRYLILLITFFATVVFVYKNKDSFLSIRKK